MNQELAIRRIHATLHECNAAGWVITGRLELVRPRDKSAPTRNAVACTHGSLDDGRGPVETATITAYIDPPSPTTAVSVTSAPDRPLSIAEARMISTDSPGLVSHGDICKCCGGASFRKMGTCLYCENCGESNGCS